MEKEQNKTNIRLSVLRSSCGFWITLILMLLPLGGLIFLTREFFWGTLWYVFSGRLFAEHWGRWMARGALDQTGIFKMYFWFTAFSVLYFPWLIIVRFLPNRNKPAVYWVFVTGSFIVVIFLLCLLTTGSNWLRLYILNMGITEKRILGAIFAFYSYCLVIGFLIWAYRPVKKTASQIFKNTSNNCHCEEPNLSAEVVIVLKVR